MISLLDEKATTVIFANVEDILLANTVDDEYSSKKFYDTNLFLDIP
jgi:hypothetical protein